MDLVKHMEAVIPWSEKTFGPGRRTKGIINHIKSEILEIEANPSDLYEWMDIVILGLDGAWRAGYSAREIAEALEEKQRINFEREWPEPTSEDAPVFHKK